jgi:hypothetical protein
MNGSTENRASGASEKAGWQDAVMTWTIAVRMLGLVRSIVHDIQTHHRRLAQLRPEKARLDRLRHTLAWPQRSRRYRLQEEIDVAEVRLTEALAELDTLQVAILNRGEGLIGFPTLVNDRRAFFSWRPEEETLQYWQFAGEGARRPIPSAWVKGESRLLGKS